MIKDFSKYQHIVKQFRGRVLNTGFESKYAATVEGIPVTERFLLKMELKRLAGPCTRLIDLRGHVDGECRSFEHGERVHFLDDVAIRVFEESVAAYEDYTFGVYEAVTNTENNFRVIYQNEKLSSAEPLLNDKPIKKNLEKTQYPAQLFTFGPYFNRCEERMNFAILLRITLENNKVIESSSSEISVNGCKFRFNSIEEIAVGQVINIRFIGLEEEFKFSNEEGFNYKVCNILLVDNIQLVGVERVYDEDQQHCGFKQFLTGFIKSNKRRYKINLENSISAIQSRCFEQAVIPKINELPIFIEKNNGKLSPRYVLTGVNNKKLYHYWKNENNVSTLNNLITEDRIERLKAAMSLGKSLLVFSFIHKSHDKYYFYSADNAQLAEDESFMRDFLGFSANKSNFSVTSLSLLAFDQSKASLPLTISEPLSLKDEHLNVAIPDIVNEALSHIDCIVVANEITYKALVDDCKQLFTDNIEITKLKNFGHKRSATPLVIDEIGVNYKNHRKELRFKYTTQVIMECDGVTSQGESNDFSESGLQLTLNKAMGLSQGQIVHLSFPNLQKITTAFALKKLPYEVVNISQSKKTICFRIFVEQHRHIGRTFFKLLIDKNKEKLTPDEYSMMSPDLAKALRNIYSSSMTIPSLVIQTSGRRYKVEAIVIGREHGKFLPHMRQLSDRTQFYNLYPLLGNLQMNTLLTARLKKMSTQAAPATDILYIAINPDIELVDKSVTTVFASEFENNELKTLFIIKAQKRGYFFAIQVKISRTGEPDMDYLSPELDYISFYAIHRGKQIEQDLWSIVGVVQLFDITQEVLLRNDVYTQAT
ncbi:MAG: hypothetical protein ACI9LM_000880 [Alteromonadaceae bacterium]|jgi:hypothetical protein